MKLLRLLILASCLLLTTALAAQDYPLVSAFNDNYVITGITTRDGKTVRPDVRFQASLLVRPFRLSEKWRLAFAFTMRSVWDAYDKSAPFRDNTYQPGLYFIRKSDPDSRLTLAFEHRSNGRPYFGNPLAAEGLEDYSRGMNYILTQWEKQWEKSVLLLQGRIGTGCGVGDYRKHETIWSFDLFKYYLGFVSVGYRYEGDRTYAGIDITPVWNKSVANVTCIGGYRFGEKFPFLFVQFHYGFDSAMCDCVTDGVPPASIRVGVQFRGNMRGLL